MLAGCIDPLAVVNDVPKIAGNTFASGVGDTAVLVTVSYDFGFIDEVAYTVSEDVSAAAWLFANRRTPSPEQFVQIHLTSTRGEVEKPKGTLRRFRSLKPCSRLIVLPGKTTH